MKINENTAVFLGFIAVLVFIFLLTFIVRCSHAADIRISWEEPDTGTPKGYRLYSSIVPGTYTYGSQYAIADVSGDILEVITSCPELRTYYVITAYNECQESLPSNEVHTGGPVRPPKKPRIRWKELVQ